jgi:hypothetical protein
VWGNLRPVEFGTTEGLESRIASEESALRLIERALTEDSETAASLSELRDRAVQHTEDEVSRWPLLISCISEVTIRLVVLCLGYYRAHEIHNRPGEIKRQHANVAETMTFGRLNRLQLVEQLDLLTITEDIA